MTLFWWIVVAWLLIGAVYVPVGLHGGRWREYSVIGVLGTLCMMSVMGPVIWIAAGIELFRQKVLGGKPKACPIQLKDPE